MMHIVQPKARKPDKVCPSCEYAKKKHGESCYCVLYGIIIGYSKTSCRGWKLEQVSERTDRD